MRLPIDGLRYDQIFTLKEEDTDLKYGNYPNQRSIKEKINFGFILLDKPPGIRSRTAAVITKNLLSSLNVKKIGYSGTLDPAVSGLLPLTLNRANKAISMFLMGGKEYIALMHLHKDADETTINEKLNEFKGKIMQLPPVRSHVKRVLREREVYYIDVLEIKGRDVLLRIGVESGTYIRKLIHDFGEKTGIGAHMAELRRTKVANLNEFDEYVSTLQDIEDAMYYYKNENNDRFINFIIRNIEDVLTFLPKVWVSDSAVDTICNGSPLAIPGVIKYNNFRKGDTIFISSLKNELIALGKATMDSEDLTKFKKGIVVKTDSVIMEQGTYPKYHKN